MVSRTAILRLQLQDSVSGPSRNVAASLKGIDGALGRLGKSGTPEVKRLVKQLEYLQKKAGAIGEFRDTRRGLKDTAVQLRAARTNVQSLEKALSSVAKPTKKMEADLRTARSTLKATAAAFKEQGAAVKASERALRSYGVAGRSAVGSSQKEIRSQLAKTILKMRELDREARKPKPRLQPQRGGDGGGLGQLVVGGAVANAGRSAVGKAFDYAVGFDQAAAFQSAIGGFQGEDRKTLNRQAEKIGGDTRFSNVDVVQAQTGILQGGVRDVKTITDLTAKVTDYALAMGVTLEEGAETVRGAALSKRIELSDTKAIGDFVDNLVWMAKTGGLKDEDVRQFMRYGGAPTTGATLPDQYAASIAALLRRSGVRGDEAGVFARSASSKLVAPTKKGRDALAAMGIDYNKFTSIDSMNSDGVGIMMKNNFGQRLTPEMKAEVADLIDNGEFVNPDTGESQSVISDSGEFVTQMSEILAPLFADSKGKVSVQDSKALAKELAAFQKYSIDSVDATGLFETIMSKNPGLGNLNAFFTDKQGGRANMIAQQWPLFQQILKTLSNTPTGIAHKIGEEANSGLYGDWTKLTGSVETALLRVGQDWEFATRPLINQTNTVVDGFVALSDNTRRLIEAVGAGIALFGGVMAFKSGTSILGNILGNKGGPKAPAGPKGPRFGGITGGAIALAALQTLGIGSVVSDEKTKADILRRLEEQKKSRTAAPASAKASVVPLQNELSDATASWPAGTQVGIKKYVAALATGGAEAEAEAARIGAKIEEQLSVTGTPNVDTSRLEHALDIARRLAAALRGEIAGVAVSSSPAAETGGVGKPRRRGGPVKAGVTYPVGKEFFTPGADGFITPPGAGGRGGGGGNTITNHFHIKGDNAESIARKIADTITSQISRSEQTVFSGMKFGDE